MSKSESAASLLRRLRREQGRTLRAASTHLGLAPSQLSRIERGERRPSLETTQKLAAYYHVPADILALQDGHVPEDIIKILIAHPEEIERLRASYSPTENHSETNE